MQETSMRRNLNCGGCAGDRLAAGPGRAGA